MRRRDEIAKQRKKQSTQESGISWWKIIVVILLIIMTFGVAGVLLRGARQESKQSLKNIPDARLGKSACKAHFNLVGHNSASKDSSTYKTILLEEYHGETEEAVVNCLTEMAQEGDHLLVESSANGAEVPCDTVHSAYRLFLGKLKCFGFDLPIDDARIKFSDYTYRTNFIAKKIPELMQSAKSGQDLHRSLHSVANFFQAQLAKDFLDSRAMKDLGPWLHGLADKIKDMTMPEIAHFFVAENNKNAKLADHYEALSRSGPTNDKLTQQINTHESQLKSSGNRLFVVAGANHLKLDKNKSLKQKITAGDELAIMVARNH